MLHLIRTAICIFIGRNIETTSPLIDWLIVSGVHIESLTSINNLLLGEFVLRSL